MKRLVMGNGPSSGLSAVALQETSKLEDFVATYPIAHTALTEDTYVDNVLLTADNLEEMRVKIKQVEFVAGKGGFFFKEWVVSKQDIPVQVIGIQLPNAIGITEEKALGINWEVKSDEFFIISRKCITW